MVGNEVVQRGRTTAWYSTYNTGTHGLKASYLLLLEYHLPVERLLKPIEKLPKNTMYIATNKPIRAIQPLEQQILHYWISSGERALFFGLHPLIPNDIAIKYKQAIQDRQSVDYGVTTALTPTYQQKFAYHYPYGKGEVIIFAEPQIFTNNYLADADYAESFIALMKQPSVQHLIIDEFHLGHGTQPSIVTYLAKHQFHYVLFQLLFLFVLLLWRYQIPLGTRTNVNSMHTTLSKTTLEGITELYQQAISPSQAAHMLIQQCLQSLSIRHGRRFYSLSKFSQFAQHNSMHKQHEIIGKIIKTFALSPQQFGDKELLYIANLTTILEKPHDNRS